MPIWRRKATIAVLLFTLGATAAPNASLRRWQAPHRASFALKGATVSTVLKSITDEFDEQVKLQAHGDSLVDLIVDGGTLFEALDQLADKARLALIIDDAGNLSLVDADEENRPHTYVGPSRLSLEHAIRATDHGADCLSVQLGWQVQSGINCVIAKLDLDRIVDDAGTTCTPLQASKGNGLPARPNQMLALLLTPPSPKAARILGLRGTLCVAFEKERDSVTLDTTAGAITKKLGASTITFHRIEDSAYLHMTVDGWPCKEYCGGAYDMPWLRVITTRKVALPADLIDSDLACYAVDDHGIGLAGQSKYSHKLREPRWEHWIGLEAVPARVVLSAVTSVTVLRIPFSFENVHLR